MEFGGRVNLTEHLTNLASREVGDTQTTSYEEVGRNIPKIALFEKVPNTKVVHIFERYNFF
jgi:hypothetical protein